MICNISHGSDCMARCLLLADSCLLHVASCLLPLAPISGQVPGDVIFLEAGVKIPADVRTFMSCNMEDSSVFVAVGTSNTQCTRQCIYIYTHRYGACVHVYIYIYIFLSFMYIFTFIHV